MKSTELLRWISSLGADALGRFALQLGATIIFARILAPEDFGRAALVIALVGVLSILVTAPFEEGLVQKRVVRKAHFAACLGILLPLAALLIAATAALTYCLPQAETGLGSVAGLVAGYSLILFADGPYAVFTAVARRHRRFGVIASGNFAGLLLGTVVGLGLAFAGAGPWSLLAVRLIARYVSVLWIAMGSGLLLLPRWIPSKTRSLLGFAGWYFADRVTTTICDALFQTLVSSWLGLAANGYLNIAMRLVEPIRGASGAISHNLAMAFFTRMQDAPERMRDMLMDAVRQTSLLLLPLFVGLACVSDTLILLIAGPEWLAAAPIAICLALAAAMIAPANFVHTAVVARGRAELGFLVSLVGLVVMVVSLAALAGYGLVAIGWSRLLYYASDAALGLLLAYSLFDIPPRRFLAALWPMLTACAVMALAVFSISLLLPVQWPILLVLVIQVLTGVVAYALVLQMLAGELLREAMRKLVGRK